MTVGEIKKELEKFDDDMEVMDSMYMPIEWIKEATWTHTNYPYDKPDKQIVMIN